MERIASFCVDHTKLDRGMYLSRQDGDVLTWDTVSYTHLDVYKRQIMSGRSRMLCTKPQPAA